MFVDAFNFFSKMLWNKKQDSFIFCGTIGVAIGLVEICESSPVSRQILKQIVYAWYGGIVKCLRTANSSEASAAVGEGINQLLQIGFTIHEPIPDNLENPECCAEDKLVD